MITIKQQSNHAAELIEQLETLHNLEAVEIIAVFKNAAAMVENDLNARTYAVALGQIFNPKG